jgi:hypothetical protein
MKSPVFEVIVGILIALAVVGTLVSAIAIWRSTHRRQRTKERRDNGVVLTTEKRR